MGERDLPAAQPVEGKGVAGLRVLLGLISGQVFLHASMSGLRMAVPLQALRTGSDKLQVGPLVAMFALAPLMLALPAGRLTDRRGYHFPLCVAVALTSLGASTVLLSNYLTGLRYPLMCLGSLLSGAGGHVGLIAIQRTAGRSARGATELMRVFSWLGMAPSISNFVGPAVAGFLIDGAGFRAAFVVLSVLPLGSLLCARVVPHEQRPAQPQTVRRPAWDLLGGLPMQRLLLVSWMMSASWDLHSFLVPVLGNERGLSASAIGSILGGFALAVTAIRFLIPVLAHRLTEATVLRSAMLTITATFALYPFATSALGMGACAVVLGFALGSSQPIVMASLHHITPAERQGEALALRSMTSNASSAMMPLLFGALGTALGAAGLFWAMGVVVGAGSFVARSLSGTIGEHA